MANLSQRVSNIAVSIDQVVGCLISLGACYPDETMSSYAYRLDVKGRFFGKLFRPMIDLVFFWQIQHCYNSMLDEKARRQMPPELR